MKQSTKNLLLIVSFISVLIISYQFCFVKTFETWKQLDELKSEINNNSEAQINKINLESREDYLDSIISTKTVGSSSLQNNLLKVLNHYSEEYSLKIISFQEPHEQILLDNSEIISFQFVLEGKYINLERLLFKLESQYSFGSISHINFETKKNHRINISYLQCMVLVQNIN